MFGVYVLNEFDTIVGQAGKSSTAVKQVSQVKPVSQFYQQVDVDSVSQGSQTSQSVKTVSQDSQSRQSVKSVSQISQSSRSIKPVNQVSQSIWSVKSVSQGSWSINLVSQGCQSRKLSHLTRTIPYDHKLVNHE